MIDGCDGASGIIVLLGAKRRSLRSKGIVLTVHERGEAGGEGLSSPIKMTSFTLSRLKRCGVVAIRIHVTKVPPFHVGEIISARGGGGRAAIYITILYI